MISKLKEEPEIFKSDEKGSELQPSKFQLHQMVIEAVNESIENLEKNENKRRMRSKPYSPFFIFF